MPPKFLPGSLWGRGHVTLLPKTNRISLGQAKNSNSSNCILMAVLPKNFRSHFVPPFNFGSWTTYAYTEHTYVQ